MTSTLQRVRRILDNAILMIADDLRQAGVVVKTGRGTYGDTVATLKVEISDVNEDGTVETKEASDFRRMCSKWMMVPSDLGRTFTSNGVIFRIIGCNPKGRKYPIIAENTHTGEQYKFSGYRVKQGLTEARRV